MDKESWLGFIATGALVLPLLLYVGCDSPALAAVAASTLLLTLMGLLVVAADDPIGDKMRAEAERESRRRQWPPG